jgi:rRNA maturation endonuclease Nob1
MCSEDEKGITVSRANVDSMLRSLSPVQPEITQDQLEEYCKKRCLTVITDDLFYKLTNGSENTATWLIRKWGDNAKCSNCGHTFKDVYDMDNHDRFCRFCGSKMIGVKGVKA